MSDQDAIDVRDAQPGDREAVFAFCARTWGDSGDYIPQVWDAWLADTSSATLVGARDGALLALSHVRMVGPDEAWIEGVRVAPDARRQGVGRVLVSRSLARAKQLGASVVRMFTGSRNAASQRLFARFAFTRVAELAWYTADALDSPSGGANPHAQPRTTAELEPTIAESNQETTLGALPTGARLWTPGIADFDRIWGWLEQSNLTPFNGGVEIHQWVGRGLNELLLREYLAAGEVYELQEWGAPQALAIVTEELGDGPELEARYVDGLSDAIGRLALLLRAEADRRGKERVWLWLPDLLILRDAMDGAGYRRGDEDPMWVYAREL